MLQTGQHATLRCVRCALRTQIAVLRQKRLGHTAFREAKGIDNSFPAHLAAAAGRRSKPSTRESRSHDGYENSIIRKTLRTNEYLPPRNAVTRRRSPQGEDSQGKDFGDALRLRLSAMREELRDAPLLQQMIKESKDGGVGEDPVSFRRLWKDFVQHAFGTSNEMKIARHAGGQVVPIFEDLCKHFNKAGEGGLDGRIKYHFWAYVTGSRFTESDIKNQRSVADLRYPTEWFPATRMLSRTIHLHVGPTNSGKTYHALQRLEKAETGTYAGPLRLLAHEVYTRMNAKGRKCSLITGEEKRLSEGADGTEADDLTACTVEMIPLNSTLDVAVIDEIQMISNADRGWAWTQAMLGVKAKEVHLCGEERTVPLIQELCASTGEKLEIHRYQRLSPLKVAEKSLDGDLSKLRKGDCIVSFSVMGIHALRRQIEKVTRRKVAIVYGSLPPETRAQQARLFNEPNNDYDFLVASDAVGMGLNLAIKRVIFETTTKFDGYARKTIGVADIKQIAGRAGRFRTAAQVNEKPASQQALSAAKGDVPSPRSSAADENVGIVTTMEQYDFPILATAMSSDPEPILTAGVHPPAAVLVRFASYFPPGTPFSFILTRLHEISKMHRRFHLCNLRDQLWIADLIEPIQGLTILDRDTFTAAPASRTDASLWADLMPALARCVAGQSGGSIVDIKELPLEVLEADVGASREYLRELERLHKGVVTYLWLSYRFAGIFNTRPLAFHVKEMVERRIAEVLSSISFSDAQRRRIVAQREKQLRRQLRAEEGEGEPGEPGGVEGGEIPERGTGADGSDVDEQLRRILDEVRIPHAESPGRWAAEGRDGERLHEGEVALDEPVAFGEDEGEAGREGREAEGSSKTPGSA